MTILRELKNKYINRQISRLLVLIPVILFVIAAGGCSGDPSTPARSVTITQKTATVTVGGTLTLTATVAPDHATHKKVTWSSDNEETVTVSESGLVTGVSIGTATISATVMTGFGASSDICIVTVAESIEGVPVEGVTVSPKTAFIAVGGTHTFTATVAPDNATNKNVSWSSDNASVATVNASGVVTGVTTGTATITVKTEDGDFTDTCAVTIVTDLISVTGVTVAPKTASIAAGETQSLTATVAPDNATNKNVSWSSGNTSVATVNASGVVTGVAAGTATITVRTDDGDFTDTCTVTVTTSTILVTGVTVAPKTASIVVGGTQSLTATVAPDNATNKNVTWSSGNTSVATVNASGVVTGVAAGTATITVRTEDGSFTDTCAVTVVTDLISVTSVTVAPKTASIVVGGTRPLTATVAPDNATNKNVTWSSNNASVATVNSSGVVTGVAAGTATITVKTDDGNFTDTCAVTVATNLISVTGVAVAPKNASIADGGTHTLTATVAPDNATNKNVTWSSSSTSVATVNSSGVVTGVAAGTATITVKTDDGDFTDTCEVTVTVTTISVTGVTVSPKFTSILVNATQQLTATVSPDEAPNKSVTWSSSNESIATVSASGVVTGVAAGSATITVKTTDGEFTDTCSVTVSEPGQVSYMEVEIEDFRLAAWNSQQWQSQGGHPAGEIHPMLPLRYEVTLNSDRSHLSIDDDVWISIYLIDNANERHALHAFSAPEDEPTDDPLYMGFYPFKLQGGKQTLTFLMHPETGIRPGQYKGIRAEFFAPAGDADIIGKTQFEWLENVTVLNLNALSHIDKAWSELTIQADSPMQPGTPGFNFNTDAIVDPVSGFFRLFGSDTPFSRSEHDPNATVTGYYAELSISLEILAMSGVVKALQFTEDNGLFFWNPTTGAFEKTFRWEEKHISGYGMNPELPYDDPRQYDYLGFTSGFPRGINGTTLVVGYAGSTPPAIKISDISLSIVAHNEAAAHMTASASNTIHRIIALTDETMRPRVYTAYAPPLGNIPMYLPENPRRVDLPVSQDNRRMDFSKQSFEWKENLDDTTLWAKSIGPRVDYTGSGKRTLYGSEEGDTGKFAARAYAFFEEYTGLVHRLPAPGKISIHDISTICGTRTGAGVDIWIVGKKFTLFGAGAEFRNDLTAKTASERNADGTYSLISDPTEIANYAKFSGMESEFNAEVVALETTLLAMPLYCNNAKPFDPSLSSLRLFESASEIGMTVQFFIIEVRAGARFTFYVDLRLTNQFQNITNGVKGTGSIALVPGIKVHGFAEGGVNVLIASAYLGFRLLFVELAVVPEYVMDGQITWQNDNSKGMPTATSNWSSYPRLGLEIGTLDGEIYVRGKVLFVDYEEIFFRWKGLRWNLQLWEGKPSDRPTLTLPLRRYS